MADAETAAPRPRLLLVRGDATPEEVAAIVAVFAARATASSAESPAPRRSAWADPGQSLRQEPVGGPGAWVRSGFTHGVRTRADW